MIERNFRLKIKIDDKNLFKKYPNYKGNFFSYNQFVEFIKANILEQFSEDSYEKFGYSVEISDD